MIKINNIDFSYSSRKILENISFDILENNLIAILGNNGAGKSTLLKCINGINTLEKGTIYISGQDVLAMNRKEVAKRIAYVAQKNEGSRVTVFDTVLLGRRPYIKWDASDEDIKIVDKIIGQMGLEEFKLRYIDEISGGELQKVMLARALAQQPRLLLLDEPTSNLDPKNQYEVLSIVKNISKSNNIAVIIVIHDLNLALRYCDRFLFIKNKSVYSYGGIEVMTNDNIEFVYEMPVSVQSFNGVRMVIPMPQTGSL
ncbi:ABC transporter ATP-binding protein [Anaerosacchariphilus polymeriproducens]|uniref:ABC transporter ATP-binding protein n=1 Tax=Anaerosacchariphilus polymeriproducens TaxID=1812858 RepID=A0A371B062_9FIRM|nr:ABC transporter ATP-binding protein [Anaerosacchariphilus polymeriproducens]RDU25120.1 ABC transporter ATP-binding protein [Anaerosacchariphilus polymeriproducens]